MRRVGSAFLVTAAVLAGAAPWRAAWKSIPQGPHALFALWEAPDGRQGVSTPALVIARKTAMPGEARRP